MKNLKFKFEAEEIYGSYVVQVHSCEGKSYCMYSFWLDGKPFMQMFAKPENWISKFEGIMKSRERIAAKAGKVGA